MTKEMQVSTNNIAAVFDKYAHQYNQSRRKLIPCFDDFYKMAVEIIPFPKEKSIKILDLGAGTGLLSFFVASVFENAEISLVDISKEMLAQARTILSDLPNKFIFLDMDYSSVKFPQKYDLIISSLSIHHLAEHQKIALYRSIYENLNPGGLFINADQVQGESASIDKHYRETWIDQVKENGVTDKELEAALERMKEDKMSPLSSQLQWLKESGFFDVNCWYKNYSFVVFGGRKV